MKEGKIEKIEKEYNITGRDVGFKEKREELTRKLQEYPELKPKLTFVWPLSENRREALEMVKSDRIDEDKALKLLESDDFVEQNVGLYLSGKDPNFLEKNYEKILPIIEEMSQDENWRTRKAVARNLANFGEKALPILDKMTRDENWRVIETAAQALARATVGTKGEKALPILEKMTQDKNPYIKEAAVHAKVDVVVKARGEKALPILEKMSQDEIPATRKAVAQNLAYFGKKALPILEKMSDDKYSYVKKAVAQTSTLIKSKPPTQEWLLSTRKPLFATPHTKELAQKILKLEEISENLKTKFGDRFVGISVFGSTAKGYLKAESDLDWGIIARDKDVSKYFKKLAQSLNLCVEHYAGISERDEMQKNAEVLFRGLFFGNRQKLRELQKRILESTGEKQWDEIRKNILEDETHLEKAAERFGIEKEKLEKIKQFVALARVPLSYQETLKIVRKRIE